MILTSIIPSNILAALRTYIRNYVASLIPSPEYISIRDNQGSLLTTISGGATDVNTETTTTATYGSLEQNNVGVITNSSAAGHFSVSYSIGIEATFSNDELTFYIFKNGSTQIAQSFSKIPVLLAGRYFVSTSFIIDLQPTDTIQLKVEGENGLAFNTDSLVINVVKLSS